jgi:hypothetical protein
MSPNTDISVVTLGVFGFGLIPNGKMVRSSEDCLDSLENRRRSLREKLVGIRFGS